MFRRLFLLTTLGIMLSGCVVVPMAFVGPAVQGFSSASIAQSAVTTGASYMVKKSTGKTIGEHAIDALVSTDDIRHSFYPKKNTTMLILPKSRPIK